jgi:hypothetical protein
VKFGLHPTFCGEPAKFDVKIGQNTEPRDKNFDHSHRGRPGINSKLEKWDINRVFKKCIPKK